MKCNDNNNNARSSCIAAGWLESKRVNDSTVTATDDDYDSALRHNNIQDIIKHKRDKSNRATSMRYTLG